MEIDKYKRLYIYRAALQEYESRNHWWLINKWKPLSHGFCAYFRKKFSIDLHQLTELYSLKPEHLYPYDDGMYWFKKGRLKPRIELLKQAIKLCEQ